MKMSVVVLTHAQPDYLRKALTGYLQQVRNPDELIIAEDGYDGDTFDVVEQYKKRADFPVIHARQEHVGTPRLAHTRNLATRSSQGDYLIYTDGDCIPGPYFLSDHERLSEPGWYVQGKRNFVSNGAFDIIHGNESLWRRFRCWLSGDLSKLRLIVHIPGLWFEQKGIEGTRGCNLAVFREDILRINGHNEEFVGFWRQDSDFVLRLQRAGVRRKNAQFSAVLYHLDHEKNKVPQDIARNNRLLEAAHTGPIYISQGLFHSEDIESRAG